MKSKTLARARELLMGRRIVDVRFLTEEEVDDNWPRSPIILELDNGSFIVPTSDPEGNDAGCLEVGTRENDHYVLPPSG